MITFMHCHACHSDLRRAPSTTCPECGRLFDPTDTRTDSRRRRQSLLFGLLLPITLTALAITTIWFFSQGMSLQTTSDPGDASSNSVDHFE